MQLCIQVLTNKINKSMDINLPPLPEIQSKATANLSPWTWTNIKLPPFNALKQKAKSVSQKKHPKIQRESQTIHLKTIKQQPKQHNQNEHDKMKKKRQLNKGKKVGERSQTYSAITETIEPRLENQRYRLKSKVQKLNKTIELARNEQSGKQQKPQPKRIRFLDDKNNMERYLKHNLGRAGWSSNSKNTKDQVSLVWSNIDKMTDHNNLKPGEFYNHLNGSFHLTNKDKLHEFVSGKAYYCRSYLIPKEYEEFAKENNRIAAKWMLKSIAKEIDRFVRQVDPSGDLQEVLLWEILQSSILQMGNQETTMLVKLCMYLEQVRRHERYTSYFENFEGYRHLNLRSKDHFYDTLIQKSFAYLEGVKPQQLNMSYKDIDYRVLILVLHYHRLFSEYDQTYNQDVSLWIIKPIASSRGAGISLAKALREFCINPENMWSEFKNRKKYENKIIQKYVSNPYILQKPQEYAGRKFDIRQWVLVSSYKNRPIIYKYHTAYCRFSHQQFNIHKLSKQIHLTNYSIFKNSEEDRQIPSIMMLEDLFSSALGDLRSRFNQQINHIITDCILSCSHIKYQQGCFELFGFDFLLDANQKLFLLQVNLNPACNAERHPKLKQQSETMTKTMISLITESKPTDKWLKLYGPSSTIDSSSETDLSRSNKDEEMQIKPYYGYQLSQDESLLAYVRYKNLVLARMFWHAEMAIYRSIFNVFKFGKNLESIDNEQKPNLNELIRFVEEKSVSNL